MVKQKIKYVVITLLLLAVFLPGLKVIKADQLPDAFSSTELMENQVDIIKTTDNTPLFDEYNSIQYSMMLNADEILIVLDTINYSENDIYYCYYNKNNQNYFGYVPSNKAQVLDFDSSEKTYRTFFNNVNVYVLPTTLSQVNCQLNNTTQVNVLNDCAGYTNNNQKFFAVLIDGKIGYVLQDNVIDTELFEPQMLESENAFTDDTAKITAFIILILALFVFTLFICYLIVKKKNEQD